MLVARLERASWGRLELCEVGSLGRCLRAKESFGAGELLCQEKPLALGSSDGLSLAELYLEGEVDASDDLIAACLLLETRRGESEAAAEARLVAAELDTSRDADFEMEPLLPCLSSAIREALDRPGTEVPELLRYWRGKCDVNAETWVEWIRASNKIRFLFGLFGALAMVEHSCDPNTRVEWSQEEQEMRLVATKAIEAKQRVSRSYLDVGPLLSSASLRQDALQRDWHFTCQCTRCKDEECQSTQSTTCVKENTDANAAAAPFLSGVVDLQHCVHSGLVLDEDLKKAVQKASEACVACDLPAVGTLQFLQHVLAHGDLHNDHHGDLHEDRTIPNVPRVLQLHFPETQEAAVKRCKV